MIQNAFYGGYPSDLLTPAFEREVRRRHTAEGDAAARVWFDAAIAGQPWFDGPPTQDGTDRRLSIYDAIITDDWP